MENLLVGNGINIQFDNLNYTTRSIVLRILEELGSDDFPRDVIIDDPISLKLYIGKLFLYARDAIDGVFNNCTTCLDEKIALADFISRYKNKKQSLRIADIGFEDYYLIHDLVCHKFGIGNPNMYVIRECMRMTYLYSIYNHGKLNLLHMKYSEKLKEFLSMFDNIFSTNYDNNIEAATGKNVFHIHGQFDKLSDVYNKDSFRNQLSDSPLEGINLDSTYDYLHSTAISTYCGNYKQYEIKQHSVVNEVLEKFANAYLQVENVKEEIDNWKMSENNLIANLGEAIKLKSVNSDLAFEEYYPIKELTEVKGKLTILGLSPYNDYHLFDIIDNLDIIECIYYFYDRDECKKIKEILPKLNASGKLSFKNVKEFWG